MATLAALALASSMAASAQILPRPSLVNPRLQTVTWQAGEKIAVTTLLSSGTRVVFEVGEHVRQVVLADPAAFAVHMAEDRDSLVIQPLSPDASSAMDVVTDRRNYRFDLRTGDDLLAAYLVQVQDSERNQAPPVQLGGTELSPLSQGQEDFATGERHGYRLRGKDELKPAEIYDDGFKTYIRFARDQALPAVFAIGPTGGEAVVNGYMRDDVFVIDRVYDRLVMRIDKASLKASRIDTKGKAK